MKTKYITIILPALFLILMTSCGGNDTVEESGSNDQALVGNPSIDAITEKLAREPGNADLYAQRAGLFYENKGYDEAIRDLQRALELDSINVGYHHLLADVYLDYFKSRRALRTMERAAALYPERIPTLLKLSEFQMILKQYEASMKTIDRILKVDPQNAEAYFMFGMNFKETGDTARAINSFQRSVELDPDLIDAWINLGYLQANTGSPLAEKYFDNAIRVDPDNILALHAKADFLRDFKNDLRGAIEVYKKINTIDPQYEQSYYNAGLLYMEQDSVEQARRQFDLVLKASPLHIRAYFYRGLAAEMMGDTEQARKDYQQALKLAPNYERPREALDRIDANAPEEALQ